MADRNVRNLCNSKKSAVFCFPGYKSIVNLQIFKSRNICQVNQSFKCRIEIVVIPM